MSKATQSKIVPTAWNMAQLWNECAYKDNKPLMKRNYIYASEIGAPYIDRFYKMKAQPYSNPPNNRSLRKFLAGNIWEYVVRQIFVACGVYKHEEMKLDATPYPNGLSVHGRLDFIAGGYIDREEAVLNVSLLNLPDFMHQIAERIIEKLAGGTLEKKILELKAISSFAMDMVERRRCAMPQHSLQGYHYQRHGKLIAEISYICKDDCRMAQFGLDKKECEKLYKLDIEEMTDFFKKNKVPPKAPLAKFDILTGNFSKNLGVEYSPYLTKIYGMKNPEEFREAVKFVLRWNRTLARFALAEQGKKTPTGKPIVITANNLAVKAEIQKAKYNFQECLKCKIAAGVSDEEIES